MALIEYDVYKQKLRDLGPELDKLSAALDVESARQEAARLEMRPPKMGFGTTWSVPRRCRCASNSSKTRSGAQEKLLGAWEI